MKVPFAPTLFLKSNDKKSEWKSLDGTAVEPMRFAEIREAKDFIKRYDGIQGFEVYGMNQWQYQYLGDEFPGDIDYDLSAMRIWSLDIETCVSQGFPDIATASEEILLISIQDKASKELIVFGSRSYEKTESDNFTYRLFKDETTMLKAFIDYWHDNYPDIVTGWNVDQFDFPYIINRVMRVLDEDWVKRLSPWGFINERKIEIRGKDVQTYDIMGIVILDYMELYKKFTQGTKESYSLKFISAEELPAESQKHELWGSFKESYNGEFRASAEIFDKNKNDEIVKESFEREKIIKEMERRGIKWNF
jgi:DNA polymerase elongation subunit (family B)